MDTGVTKYTTTRHKYIYYSFFHSQDVLEEKHVISVFSNPCHQILGWNKSMFRTHSDHKWTDLTEAVLALNK